MLYDVEQISDLTNLSKATIYKKFKLKELQPYIVKKQGKSYVDQEGFNLIKQGLNLTDVLNEELNFKEIETDETPCIATDNEDLIKVKNDLINSLNEQVQFLKEQLGVKDKQLESKDKLLENMQVLVKNSQIKRENDIPMLEAHFMELDQKLADIKIEMEQRKINYAAAQQKKGFWDRLLGK
jgi:hypothetical protein